MRAVGNVVAGGVVGHADGARGLPMEEREDRDVVRARREAKRGQLLARSPFAGLATSEKAAIASQAEAVAPAASALAEAKYTTPDLEPEPDVEPEPTTEPEPVVEPEPQPDRRDDEHQALAVVAAPQPKPTPRPAPKPVERTARAHPPLDKAGIVREYVEDRKTVDEIAAARGHAASTVRRLLKATPGVEIRDDRKTGSGGQNKTVHAPEVVDAVRRLYTGEEQLTQEQVAERLGLTEKAVAKLMREHDIPARPPAHQQTAAQLPRVNPAELMQERLAAAGVTSTDVRTWAREHDLACSATGVVPQRLLAAYLRADGAAPVEPDATDLAITHPEPTPPALAADDDERSCAKCSDRVGQLSSRDWCDACELDEANASTPQPPRVPDGIARDLIATGDVLRSASAAGLGPVLRAAGDLLHAVADLVAPTQDDYALAADGDA